MIIYQATNKVNGKCYIGQTIQTLDERKSSHLYTSMKGDNNYFHNAIRKYGWDNFTWEVIDDTCTDMDELNEMEFHYIKQYHSHVSEGGYNLMDGGYNQRHSEVTKSKMSKSHKGFVVPEEQRRKISETLKGKSKSKAHKRNISKGKKGKKMKEEVRVKMLKMWRIIHPDGYTVEIVIGLNQFCEQHGLHRGCMHRGGRGERSHHKGYNCMKVTS